MKVIKVYLINSPNACEAQIYCIKHENDEDLTSFMEKIYLRCPSLRDISYEPQIYWYDLENDKIKVTCNDDLRFFLEESEITKVIVDYSCIQELSKRKRHFADDECSESSKRIRRKLQEIELDSDSSMDTDDEVIHNINVTSTNNEEIQPVASTSKMSENESPNVNILSVEVIKSTDEIDGTENSEESSSKNEQVTSQEKEGVAQEKAQEKRKNSESNKIVISDSSDEEEEPLNRRHSEGNYSSSYSFAGVNNERSRASFDDNFRSYHQYRYQYRQHFRNQHADNIARIYQNAQAIRENAMRNAEALRNNAMRNIRHNANLFPQILSTFQSHFRPLFQSQNFSSRQQQFFRRQ